MTPKTVSFIAIIPLARLFEYGGDQMALYTGKDLGDLVVVTLNKYVILTHRLTLRIWFDAISLILTQHGRGPACYYTAYQVRVSIGFTAFPLTGPFANRPSFFSLRILQSTIIGIE